MISKGTLEKRIAIPVGMKIWLNGNVVQVGPQENAWMSVKQLIASIAACDHIVSLHNEAGEHMRHLLDMHVEISDAVKLEPVTAPETDSKEEV